MTFESTKYLAFIEKKKENTELDEEFVYIGDIVQPCTMGPWGPG